MKKIVSLLLALMMVCSLSACGGKEESNSKRDNNANNSKSTAQAGTAIEKNNQATQPSAAPAADIPAPKKDARIKLTFNNEDFVVKMYDNPTSRDFLSRLPLTLTFKEFGGFEKLTILDKGLSTEDAPPGEDPEVGDFGYYAPWKDVNMYYKDWSYSSGLVKLGKIESRPEEFTTILQAMHEDFTVTIQKID